MSKWKFDSTVAATFVDHARDHIPNYDVVIDKCVALCDYHLASDSSIIDVGCATGETLRRLRTAGFVNLTGVDASQEMLSYCDTSIAHIVHSSSFPGETFDAVLCNWTLHFMQDKVRYLIDIYNNLNNNGLFVISDKTSLNPTAISFYHMWKHRNGLSWDEIYAKEQAVKDIMYINNIHWYLTTLDKIGFKNIQIIDASWCFTTFLCNR